MHTRLCDLLGIDVPLLLAPFGPWEQVDLAAAVCDAGGLGSLGTAARPLPDLRAQWARLRALTDRPFAINHTARPLDEEAFAATLAFGPAAVSFHLAVPEDLVARAHDAGVLWIQQVMDVRQAEQAVRAGADVIVAQGAEAGGHAGSVSTFVLVPQVVDLAGEIPVVAAGGIADGRGLAAALALGAAGVSIGTRFLATHEMAIGAEAKRRLVAAGSLDAVMIDRSERFMPPSTRPGPTSRPRALRTPFLDRFHDDPDGVDVEAFRAEVIGAVRNGRGYEQLPMAGQSVGLVHDVVPAAELVRRVVAEAEAALDAVAAAAAPG
jgi:nitronate monooxygenase/enoyl-[acyl-carrier protein] reductase II